MWSPATRRCRRPALHPRIHPPAAWVAVSLVQPIIWLLIFGALFKQEVEIPGFQGYGILMIAVETLIGAVTFVLLPLTFLSSAFMQLDLAPAWIRDIARFNPVNWAAQAARSAATQSTDWNLVATRIGFLAALLLISTILATRAFRAYQRSI